MVDRKLENFKFIGHSDLGGDIDFGDVWGHGDFAYVGTRCGDLAEGGGGVRVVDITDPANPVLVSVLRNPSSTRVEDVVVREVSTPSFTGTLAVVGIQACFGAPNPEPPTGLAFYDVTDPANPVGLGRWTLPDGAIGCHEIDAVQREDGRVLAACAHNFVDHFPDIGEPGVDIVEATDPRNPVEVGTFALGVRPLRGVGCFQASFAHSARFQAQGRELWVSYWDAGTVNVDVSNPSAPQTVSTTRITPPDEDGDNHSMTLADGGEWVVINPEDFSPVDVCGPRYDGWGEAYVYQGADTRNPTFLGSFATANTHSQRTDGIFTVHNTEVTLGRQFFSSWYSDGIVWWSMRGNGASAQKGQFVPPSGPDAPPLMWGVYIDSGNDLILGSDILSGLWIVRPIGLGDF